MNSDTPTPRTDKELDAFKGDEPGESLNIVSGDFARTLERELAQAKEQVETSELCIKGLEGNLAACEERNAELEQKLVKWPVVATSQFQWDGLVSRNKWLEQRNAALEAAVLNMREALRQVSVKYGTVHLTGCTCICCSALSTTPEQCLGEVIKPLTDLISNLLMYVQHDSQCGTPLSEKECRCQLTDDIFQAKLLLTKYGTPKE